jgi:hypothetical protein
MGEHLFERVITGKYKFLYFLGRLNGNGCTLLEVVYSLVGKRMEKLIPNRHYQ